MSVSHSSLTGIQQKLSGIHTALATPFLKGEIDWFSLRKMLRQQVEGGVQGLVICGTTGETPTLTLNERQKIFEFVRSEVAGALTLSMGTGSNSTSETIAATRLAKSLGAAAALVVVPYYNKPSQRGLVAHFTKVAEEADGLPIILYNVPGRTITKLELETIQTLSKVPGIVAIKEASGNIEFGEAIAKTTSLLVMSGDDDTCMKLAGVGGRGVISVISHLNPGPMTALFKRAVDGQSEGAAAEWAQRFGALNRDLYLEANPIPVKYALYRLGLIDSPEMRLPLTELDPKHRPAIDQALKAGGLL